MKKKKKNDAKKQDKVVKGLKFIAVLCVLVIVCEAIYIGVKIYQREQNTVYVDTFAAVEKVSDGYIGVGSSDFKKSKYNSYSKSHTKAKIVKYDKDKNVLFETAYKKGIESSFNDVEETKDGYIAVGSAAYTNKQIKEHVTNGLLVLYDKKGEQVNSKKLEILDDTVFTKVEVLKDGYLVIGQSILENYTIGNDPNGGGIIIKYDFDLKEVWRANHGGSKSGIFNDLVIDDDAIYLVGKDAARYGVFAKYTLDGKKEFVKTFEFTDTIGFSSIAKIGDNFAVVGSKTVNISADDQDKITEALIAIYDKDGSVKRHKTYKINKSARFNKVIVDGDEIIAVGHTAKKDEEESTDAVNVFRYSGILAKYTFDGDEILKKQEKGSRDTYFSDILATKDGYIVVGQTSSKELGGNNKDLTSFFLTYDKKGKRQTSETVFNKVVFD